MEQLLENTGIISANSLVQSSYQDGHLILKVHGVDAEAYERFVEFAMKEIKFFVDRNKLPRLSL
jgi:hypothetical protein